MENVEKYKKMRKGYGISESDIEQELEEIRKNSPTGVSETEWLEDVCGWDILLTSKTTQPSDYP